MSIGKDNAAKALSSSFPRPTPSQPLPPWYSWSTSYESNTHTRPTFGAEGGSASTHFSATESSFTLVPVYVSSADPSRQTQAYCGASIPLREGWSSDCSSQTKTKTHGTSTARPTVNASTSSRALSSHVATALPMRSSSRHPAGRSSSVSLPAASSSARHVSSSARASSSTAASSPSASRSASTHAFSSATGSSSTVPLPTRSSSSLSISSSHLSSTDSSPQAIPPTQASPGPEPLTASHGPRHGLSGGTIAGIVIGSIAGLLLLVLLLAALLLWRRRRMRANSSGEEEKAREMSDQPQAGAPSTFPWPLAAPTASNSGSTIAPHFVSEMSQREYDDEEILAENIAYGRLRGQEQREHHTSRSTYSTADDVQLITRNRLSDPIIVQGAGMPPRQSWESGMSNGSSLLPPPRQSRSRAGLSPSPAETLASYAYSCPEERAERNSSVSTSPMAPLAGPGREQRSGSVMGCEWTESAVPVDMRYPTPIDEGAGRQQNALQLDLGSRDSVQQEYEADDERRNSSADPGWSSRASSSSMEEDESAGRVAGSYWTKGLTPARHLSGTSTLEQGPSEHGSCEAALSAIFEPVDWVGVAAHGGPRGSLGVADSPARFADALDGAASAPRSSVTSSVSVALDDDRVMWSPLAQQGYQGSTLAYRAASTTSSLRSSMRAAQRWAQTYDIDGERQADRTSNAAL